MTDFRLNLENLGVEVHISVGGKSRLQSGQDQEVQLSGQRGVDITICEGLSQTGLHRAIPVFDGR